MVLEPGCHVETDAYHLAREGNTLHFSISSSVPLVSRLIADIYGALQPGTLPEDHTLSIVLRELLVNAVTHGNSVKPERRVSGTVSRLKANRFWLEIKDEGKGFDYEKLDFRMPEMPDRVTRRGYILVHALSDSIEFRDGGSSIFVEVTVPVIGVRDEESAFETRV